MGQVGYYAIIIALGVGNLALAVVAYVQRRTQIKGNALRERQVDLAELRNHLAERRLAYLAEQVELLSDIRAELRQRSGRVGPESDEVAAGNGTPAAPAMKGVNGDQEQASGPAEE
jgi:hypothetical protein